MATFSRPESTFCAVEYCANLSELPADISAFALRMARPMSQARPVIRQVAAPPFVAFTLIFTDFGVPKVIGGNYNMLAADIYKQVIDQQDFHMGAVVSVVLLIPDIITFTVDRIVQRKQVALLSARAVPYVPKPSKSRDIILFVFCLFVAALILAMVGMAQYAALKTFWPYNITLTLAN